MKNLREVCKEFATKNRINYSENGLDQCGIMVSEWIKQHIPFETRPPSPEEALETLIRYRLAEVERERDELKQQLYRRTIERDEAAARAEKAEQEVARLDEENNEITDLKSRLSRQVQANQDLVEVNCSLIKERDEANQKVAKYSAAMTDWRQETERKFNELGLVLKARDKEIAALKRQYLDEIRALEQQSLPAPESKINHPKHYNQHPSGVECITIVEHFGFNLGNAVKYVWRCGLKEDEIEDLRKANWYIEREIQKREKAKR